MADRVQPSAVILDLMLPRLDLIAAEDDEVDKLYDQVYQGLVMFMVADPATTERATWLLWVAHNLERIADRLTNICAWVVFLVTGRMEEMNVSKY